MRVALPVAGGTRPDADIPELTEDRAYGARLRPLFLASTRYLAYSTLVLFLSEVPLVLWTILTEMLSPQLASASSCFHCQNTPLHDLISPLRA